MFMTDPPKNCICIMHPDECAIEVIKAGYQEVSVRNIEIEGKGKP